MLERLYIFQTSGLPLFTWTNPLMEAKDSNEPNPPSITHVTALIAALLQFSQSTLKHKMEAISLDNGGFLLVTTEHDIVFVGFFSKGDSRWRARRVLRKVRDSFWKKYGDLSLQAYVDTRRFENFDDELSSSLKWTTRVRSNKQFLGTVAIFTPILVIILWVYKFTFAAENDLLAIFSGDITLYFIGYVFFSLIAIQYVVGGAPSVKMALIVAIIQAILIDAIFFLLWSKTPLFFLDILDAVISTGYLIGFVVDRMLFLEK